MSERALVQNAGDPRQVRDATKTKRHREKLEALDRQTLLAQAPFRRELWRMLTQAGVYEANEEQTEYARGRREGKRQFGLMLIAQYSEADPEAYVNLILENAKAKQKDAILPEPPVTDAESRDEEAGPGAGPEPEIEG